MLLLHFVPSKYVMILFFWLVAMQNFELSIYNPRASSTSKTVSCNSTLCMHHHNQCLGSYSHCPYVISYISADTSTSGILVEDVMHLATEDHPESVQAYITFG